MSDDGHTVSLPTIPTQRRTLEWVAERWPDRTTPIWRAAKLCEEAGEVMGAVIKLDEGRKTTADVAQEAAQVVICAMALAESVGFNLFDEVAKEYQRCMGHANDCEMMVKLLTGDHCTCGYDPDSAPCSFDGCDGTAGHDGDHFFRPRLPR